MSEFLPFILGRVNRQSIIGKFNKPTINKLIELWEPEVNDVVFDGTSEFTLTDENITSDKINKEKYIPLLRLNKAAKIIEDLGFDSNKITFKSYICMEDLVAKQMMAAISTKYNL